MAEVVHQRRPQQRGGGNTGGHARDQAHFHVQLLFAHQLQHQPRHAVDTRVTAADQCHVVPGLRQLNRRLAAFDLFAHAGFDHLLVAGKGLHQVGIGFVAHDDFRRLQRLDGFHGHHGLRTRADSDYA